MVIPMLWRAKLHKHALLKHACSYMDMCRRRTRLCLVNLSKFIECPCGVNTMKQFIYKECSRERSVEFETTDFPPDTTNISPKRLCATVYEYFMGLKLFKGKYNDDDEVPFSSLLNVNENNQTISNHWTFHKVRISSLCM